MYTDQRAAAPLLQVSESKEDLSRVANNRNESVGRFKVINYK